MDMGRGVSLLRGAYRFTMPRQKCRKLTTLEVKILSSDVLAVAHIYSPNIRLICKYSILNIFFPHIFWNLAYNNYIEFSFKSYVNKTKISKD